MTLMLIWTLLSSLLKKYKKAKKEDYLLLIMSSHSLTVASVIIKSKIMRMKKQENKQKLLTDWEKLLKVPTHVFYW